MGLDIYMYKTKRKLAERAILNNKDVFDLISESQKVAYFRKVNFIYGYFVSSITDAEVCLATKDDIRELAEDCESVLKVRDEEFSSMRLPTFPGFFFGNLEYNNKYYADVKECKEKMEDILTMLDDDEAILIHFSW